MSVRFGLIGYGAFGGKYARVICQLEGCELAVIAVPSEQSRERARRETGAAVLADYHDLLAREDVDAVCVVAPNYLHEPVALAALAARKHVLLEKPMALTPEGCDRIIDAARAAGRKLLVGHVLRFSPVYVRMMELIAEGRIGHPRYVLVDLWRRPYSQGASGWKRDPARVGSSILEEPVHYFDVVPWFLQGSGEPQSVTAFANRRTPGAADTAAIYDNFTAVLHYADGAYGVISQSLSAVEHYLSVKVFGSHGVVRSEWHAQQDRSVGPSFSLSISEGTRMVVLPVEAPPDELFELGVEIGAFAAAIERGAPLPFSPAEARRAVALCLAAERSIQTGTAIESLDH
jgi:myo-inositol 2-dehydrogenase/D-chiro-inositol 1-dehydrogenase